MFSCELRDGLLNVSWRKKETAVIKLRFSLGVRMEYKGNKFPLYPCFASVQQFSIYPTRGAKVWHNEKVSLVLPFQLFSSLRDVYNVGTAYKGNANARNRATSWALELCSWVKSRNCVANVIPNPQLRRSIRIV